MDTSKLTSFFHSLVECLNKDRKKVKNLFTRISSVFSDPSGKNFGNLLKDFPLVKLLQWIKEQIPELILACAPMGDHVDGQISCLSTVLNEQTFVALLLEALSNAQQTMLLYKSLEQLALQLPKIGIAELLVSSPLFPISALDPTSMSGMIATQSKACAGADYLHHSEEETTKLDSLLPEKLSQDSDLCEASPPKKRAKKETHILKDCSSKYNFYC